MESPSPAWFRLLCRSAEYIRLSSAGSSAHGYEPEVSAGVDEAAGSLGLLSLDVEAGLLSFDALPESDFESALESALDSDLESESPLDELALGA
jgi:hypothetical protein